MLYQMSYTGYHIRHYRKPPAKVGWADEGGPTAALVKVGPPEAAQPTEFTPLYIIIYLN
ncbi:hypothetical protein CCP4SC76_4890005 [Gammaproteobacteria bacterium]